MADPTASRTFRWTASAVFIAAAAAVFVVGDEWNAAPRGLFLVWLAIHLVYGVVVPTFWALPVALLVPLAVAPLPWDGEDTALWVQVLFAEMFYGVPFVFIGVIGRRLWQARRAAELPGPRPGEQAPR